MLTNESYVETQHSIQIEKDWRSLIFNACWSWILCWIPLALEAARIATTNYHSYDPCILTQESGIITKKTINIDLRRARMINGTDSPFTGGKITVTESNGYIHELPYIKNARIMANNLRNASEAYSRQQGDGRHVILN
jgi:hypothetical protein